MTISSKTHNPNLQTSKPQTIEVQQSQKIVVLLPTYNEAENISSIITSVMLQQQNISTAVLEILVIDDKSPDGTADIVRNFTKSNSNIHLISGDKKGLGVAYKRGIKYAINVLKADYMVSMDSDFSHDPKHIPEFYEALKSGNDFVIGSRYVEGGSIPKNWPLLRKLNSIVGNLFANKIAGLKSVKDCTGGYRAFSTKLIKKISLENLSVKGYGYQINLLHEALSHDAQIVELPIHFIDRTKGVSKMSIKDILEFVLFTFKLRLRPLFKPRNVIIMGVLLAIAGLIAGVIHLLSLSLVQALTITLVSISLVLVIQGLFTLYLTLYTWEDPKRVSSNRSPQTYEQPLKTFTALLPARNEENVIAHTIAAVHGIDYPEELKETIVIVRSDDHGTIKAAKDAIAKLGKKNIRIVCDSVPIPTNKPMKLNIGAAVAKNEVICIFDAEDEPHKDIYNIVNTVMIRQNADIVQCGVQLMNFASHWFSALNVLEYYFWFKSALRFFAKVGLITLGGNTVFFKKEWMERIGGWDEYCLTEDADVGLRLSKAGAKIEVLYDQEHATQEETPHNLENFIKQRTRWNQGFIQVLLKGEWLNLNTWSQRFLAFYLLFWPIVQSLLFMYIPISLTLMFIIKLPVWATMITILPVYMLGLQMVTIIVAFYQFVNDYKLKYSVFFPIRIILWYFPYQFILGLSAYRAVWRLVSKQASWEKTTHVNAHRKSIA
jgi:glycosyltransferase XagB